MIRRAKEEDKEACLKLLPDAPTITVGNWGQVFVCEINGEIQGFVVCKLLDEQTAFGRIRTGKMEPLVTKGDRAIITERLYDRAKAFFEDMGCVAIEALIGKENKKMIEFAEGHGWYQRTPLGIVYRMELEQ